MECNTSLDVLRIGIPEGSLYRDFLIPMCRENIVRRLGTSAQDPILPGLGAPATRRAYSLIRMNKAQPPSEGCEAYHPLP